MESMNSGPSTAFGGVASRGSAGGWTYPLSSTQGLRCHLHVAVQEKGLQGVPIHA